MSIKYIVIESNGVELMFVFPDVVVHARMFEMVKHIRSGFPGDRNWDSPYREAKIVSAGFFSAGHFTRESESLKVVSRPNTDEELFACGGIRKLNKSPS